MHPAAHHYARTHIQELPGDVVEIGGADWNGGLRSCFTWSGYVSVDIIDGPGVDVVAPFVEWAADQPEQSRDLVLACEVFEHTDTWPDMVIAAHRLLRPNGRFVGTCAHTGRPAHSAVGADQLAPDEFYRNVPAGELADALTVAGFTEFEVNVTRSGLDVRWCAVRT